MLKQLYKSHLIQNSSKLVLGTGLGQLIAFLAAPIIARQFSPQDFGEQSVIISIASPMVTLTSMALPIAIVIARTDREALALSRLAFVGSLIFAPLATALLLLDDMWLLHWLGLMHIAPYAVLIPVIVVLATMNMSANYLMIRDGAYGTSAWASFGSAALGNLSKMALGLAWPGTLSLIAGNAIGYLVGPIMTLRLRRRRGTELRGHSLDQLKEIALRYRDFPLFRAPQNFVAAVSQSIPVVALTAGFGPETAGYFAISIAIAGAPISLIGNAVQSVLYPRLTEAIHAGENTTKLLLRSTFGMMVVAAPFFTLIAAFGPWLFAALLGPEWQEAGVYSALLVPWLWLGLANRPAVSIIPALGLQAGLLVYELIATAAKLAAILVGIHFLDSARWTVGLFSGTGAFFYFLLIVWVFWSNRSSMRRSADAKTS